MSDKDERGQQKQSFTLPEFELKPRNVFDYLGYGFAVLFSFVMIWEAYAPLVEFFNLAPSFSLPYIKITICALLLSALIYLFFTVIHYRKRLESRLIKHGTLARATIFRARVVGDGEGTVRYIDYRFTVLNGCSFTGQSKDNDDFFLEGDEMDVVYDPADPEVNFGINNMMYYQPSLTIYKKPVSK